MTIDRAATLRNFQQAMDGIRYESEDDEGAFMYASELQAVINAIKTGTDEMIKQQASSVSEDRLLVFKGEQ